MAAFLAAHPEFAPVPLAGLWPAVLGTASPLDGPWLRLSPARHDTDGFFAAVLERRAADPGPAAGSEPESEAESTAEPASEGS